MLISIVIPSYNGQDTLGNLVAELVESTRSLFTVEIILVNDGSTDDTEQACIDLYQKYPTVVRFFSLAKNFGEHSAVMAGIHQVRGDYVVIMDDDFQNPVAEVIKLIDYAVAHPEHDVVYTYYGEKKHSLFRNLGSYFNDKMANIMLSKPKDLYLCSFKIFNKFVADNIIKYDSPFTYIDGLILQTTNKVGKFKVEHHERTSGRSTYTILKLVSLWSNMFTNFSVVPLRVSTLLGMFFAVVGFLWGIEALIEKVVNPNVPQGYTSLIVVVLFFAGVQLFSIGIAGEYIGRLFLTQNKKPQFVIRKKFDRPRE